MEKAKLIFFKILLVIGISIFFYPYISDYVNSISQTRAVVNHNEALKEFDPVELERMLAEANAYNEKIAQEKHPIHNPDRVEGYLDTLNPFNNGMMGYVTIEKINVNLPIYHGMSEGIIQVNVGHLKGTSLPVGGLNTHSVISTHSGLPSAKLFTDLNKLEIGDEFTISVLNQVLTYEIDQIITVLPHEIDELEIVDGKDYVTMFTCTPYGINTHRLFVRGERVEKEITEDQQQIEKKIEQNMKWNIVKLVIILGVILIILISIVKDLILFIKERK